MSGRKPVTACTATEWREICDTMRATVPPPHRYSWRFIHSDALGKVGDEGDCDLKPRPEDLDPGKRGIAIIRVARGLSASHTALIMIHECAHAVDAWSPGPTRGHHDKHFDLAYGDVYRAYRGETTG